MIKHLKPRSEEEIESFNVDALIKIARSRIGHTHAYNSIKVFINTYEVTEFANSGEHYIVEFKRDHIEWEYVNHTKHSNGEYMHKDWYKGAGRGERDAYESWKERNSYFFSND